MSYTIKDLRKEFPTDDHCLDYIFRHKYPTGAVYYRINGRKSYVNSEGHQIHPLKGTIFEKSRTPLTLWFHAMFLFAISKNGVSAKEVQRQLGVTYKTAWRMCNQIRKLMEQGGDMLSGTIEVDETYFGKRGTNETKFKNKAALMGMVERKGRVRAMKIPHRGTEILLDAIEDNVAPGSRIMSDELNTYKKVRKFGYSHGAVKHGKRRFVWGDIHTNTIEGFWGQLKRSIHGTYHFVSSQHLQSYVDEFCYRYNLRDSSVPIFVDLLQRASR